MSKTFKSRFAAIIISAALLLTAAFGVNFLSVRADGQAFSASENGVRFKQVEAGEDFVIGLTYDNELYGWSLKASPAGSDPKSLGDVYGKQPAKITFSRATGDTSGVITAIATTRTTAALVTSGNYIYTWGYDMPATDAQFNDQKGGSHWLLLRTPANDNDATPTAIAYEQTAYNEFIPQQLHPENISNFRSIKGSEDNYTVSFVPTSGTSYFTWGATAYNLGFMGTYTSSTYNLTSNVTDFSNSMDIYMGGNTIVYVDGVNAYLRGKNYYVPSGVSATAIDVTGVVGDSGPYLQIAPNHLIVSAGLTDKTFEGYMKATGAADADTVVRYKNAIAGSNANQPGTIADRTVPLAANVQGKGTAPLSNAGGAVGGGTPLTLTQNTVSVGNGFVYYINNAHVLQFAGNKTNGQDGNSFAGISGTPVAVAAGRTKSGTSVLAVPNGGKSLGALSKSEASLSDYNKLTVDAAFSDGSEYISGAITESAGKANSVYVWNNAQTPVDLTAEGGALAALGLGRSEKNQIVSLSSGYYNNLFAISNLGKVYRITYNAGTSKFEAVVYDSFDGAVNWEVQSDNEITLSSSERGADAKSVILTLGSAAAADENSPILDTEASVYNPLVKTNNIKDTYRILRPEEDKNVDFVKDVVTLASGPAVTFTQSETDITETSRYQYFDYKFIESDGTTAIQITPYKKTTAPITMTFYIGRYDSTEQPLGSEVFYDYYTVSVKINIGNTAAQFDKFSPYVDPDGTGNASIPLLDPNNANYKHYSIALSNVSEGFKTLSDGLNGLSVTNFSDTLKASAAEKDPGFPAEEKQETDDYYGLNSYYDGVYRYFGYDRDGDLITVSATDGSITNGNKENFDIVQNKITLSIDLTNRLSGVDEAKLADYVNLVYNDIYGLRPKYDTATHTLTLSYHIVLITGKKSTNTVTYNEGSLNNFSTAESSGAKTFGLIIAENESDPDTAHVGIINMVPVHVQASLTTNLKENGTTVSGKDGQNRYTVMPAAGDIPTVGGENGSITFLLSDYFPKGDGRAVDTTGIQFVSKKTTGGNTVYNDWAGFKDRFDSSEVDVSLSATELTVTPKTLNTFVCEVEVRRFQPNSTTEVFDGAESLVLTFKFTPNRIVFSPKEDFTFGRNNTLRETQTVSVSDVATGNAELMQFSIADVTDASVLKVTLSADKKTLTLKPVKSGRVMVTYYVTQYRETFKKSHTVDVESMTTLDETLNLVDIKRVFISELKNNLKTNNPKSEDIIEDLEVPRYLDGSVSTDSGATIAEGKDKSYYFLTETNGDWTVCDKPEFIHKVSYKGETGQEYFELQMGSFSSTSNKTYKIAFRLVSPTDSDTVFEASVKVKPAKMYVKNGDGQDLVINADVKNLPAQPADKLSSWYGTAKGEIVIPLRYLLNSFEDVIENLTDYTIKFVLASDGSEAFFDYTYTATDITVKPQYPTESVQTIEVSISDNSVPYILSFNLSVEGIVTTLAKHDYLVILTATAIAVFALLLIIFIIRMGVYWKKKADQKRIIRKNQMLIKMRDKMHNKTESATREQLVKTKLKMEDPKYAKMFNDLRKDKEAETGISLDNSMVAQKAETKTTDKSSKKKKKGGKKSIEDLKAELEAKKAAFAQMQSEGISQPIVDAPMFDADTYSGGMSREDVENQIKAKLGSDDDILFDVEAVGNPDDNNNF